jgi:hypothetical protein
MSELVAQCDGCGGTRDCSALAPAFARLERERIATRYLRDAGWLVVVTRDRLITLHFCPNCHHLAQEVTDEDDGAITIEG